ncbi:MAG: RagB/SusD family nutrient uptake outer membrane protein [Bacteroidales bacterium]|nr:RagB/SusD family nutrient uptake outer membrane protein [Bacteroidales bacterium]
MRYLMKSSVLLLVILFMGSCEEYLDKSPESGITGEQIFTNYSNYRGFNDRLYLFLRDFHFWHPRYTPGTMADLEQCDNDWQDVNAVTNGNYYNKPYNRAVGWLTRNISSGASAVPGNAFKALRIANKSIKNIDRLEDANQEDKDHILGQAYFFRAWFNFELIRRYGGMPYFDQVFTPDSKMDIPRETYRECTNQIVEDCNKAVELLPEGWPQQHLGRVTVGAAMTLKGMALLYDASPTMNNDPLDPDRNSTTYDVERVKEAASVLYDVIELANEGVYSLESGDNYRHIFFSRNEFVNDEAIFYRVPELYGWSSQQTTTRRPDALDWRGLYVPPTYDNGGWVSMPTQNAVDKYETENGWPIDHPNAGYDPDQPYQNRDPRFYNNILYNDAQWGVDDEGEQLYIETYEGGRDKPENIVHPTGYFNRKYWPESGNKWQNDYNYYMNWIYFRLSGVYLYYAEAVNEGWGPDGSAPDASLTALEAVNTIRNRVNMPDVKGTFHNQADLRERIRNELAVELFGEHKRWWDLRRWYEMHKPEHKTIYRMRIDKVAEDSFNYTVEEMESESRVFDDKHYWYPLPKDHVEMLKNLKQNPGW